MALSQTCRGAYIQGHVAAMGDLTLQRTSEAATPENTSVLITILQTSKRAAYLVPDMLLALIRSRPSAPRTGQGSQATAALIERQAAREAGD